MSNGTDLSSELAGGARSVLDRVGEFFHIFDLSFFVAGVSSFGAMSFLYVVMDKPHVFPFVSWVGAMALVVACYISGLVAFAGGRALNGRLFRRRTLSRALPAALRAHRLDHGEILAYTSAERPGLWWLYIRMWSEVAHDRTVPLVVQHLMRYWAMAATYDGVAFSFLLWAASITSAQFAVVAPRPISHRVAIAGALACITAATFCFQRGAAYFEYQIEDMVAYFAVKRRSLINGTGPETQG